MSYQGLAPKANRLRLQPRSADPVNPAEGDIFYSDGTPRTEGLWFYKDGGWNAVATGATNKPFASKTTTYSVTGTDEVLSLSSSSFTVTLPTAVGAAGKPYTLTHNGTSLTQVYTIATTGGQTIGGYSSYTLYTAGESLSIISDGSNWLITDHKTQTDWINAGTTIISATTTAPTKGVTSIDTLFWRRIGDSAHVRVQYQQSATTGAAAGSGDYLFGVPANMTIDTAKVNVYATVEGWNSYFAQALTIGSAAMGNGADAVIGVTVPYDSSYVRIFGLNVISTGTPNSTGGYQITNNAAMYYSLDFIVPISNWRP